MAEPNIVVRHETPEDVGAIRKINLEAFNTPYEANLVDRLREVGAHILSMVAIRNDRVVGHILFSPVIIDGPGGSFEVVGLAPMAVYPHVQRSGIGGSMIRASLDILRERNIPAVILLGHPEYYPRFGFRPASDFGIRYGYRVPSQAFMALELQADVLRQHPGMASYHKAFDETQVDPAQP